MKQIRRKLWLMLVMVAMVMSLTTTAFAAKKTVVTDIDSITELTVDFTQAAQIPLEGWYSKTLESGRTVEMYVPTYASCRAYFTVVAVPNGVKDVHAWADMMGFTKTIADRGEVLVVLEPKSKKWGKLDAEQAYVAEAMAFINGQKNAAGLTLWTHYSTYYLAGYGEGAPALEAWAAANPILVGSQVYVGGKTVGKAALKEIGSVIYDGTNTGGYDPGIADLDEFEKVLGEHGYAPKAITKSQVAVPTWFIDYTETSYDVKYWKSANDCVAKASGTKLNKTYWQDKNSDAFQTEYANSCTKEKHGISCVKVSWSLNASAQKIGKFLYGYSRYNVPFAYSNHISERQDFTAVRVAAQKAAQKAGYLTKKQYVPYDAPVTADSGVVYDGYYVLARKQGKMGQGIVESGIFASSDDDNDGVLDAHEYLMYIPDIAKKKAVPVVLQFPGNTQSVSVGFDSTQWWRVANDEGAIIVIVGETYQGRNTAALTWKNADMSYYPIMDIIKNKIDGKQAKVDWERIYGSGHSAGSSTVQTFVHTHPEFFAGVGSTSFGARNPEGVGEAVPTMLINGQSDLPFLMNNLWDNASLQTNWFGYLAKVNDLKVKVPTIENADAKVEGSARTYLYTWNNKQEFPMVVWGQTYLREHNCYPAEIPMFWNFLKHYTKDAEGNRYYDGQLIEKKYADPTPIEETKAAANTIGSYQKRVGYFTYQLAVGDTTREVEVYIPERARQREYWVCMTLPEGVESNEFLTETGWFELADKDTACLLIMKPENGKWGDAEAEFPYVNAAMSSLASNGKYYSAFTYDYVVGYGAGAPALQLWAAQNPLKMISQAYVDAKSDAAYDAMLAAAGATQIKATPQPNNMDFEGYVDKNGDPLTQQRTFEAQCNQDVAIPTYLAGETSESLVAYWNKVNDGDSITTSFSDIETQVVVEKGAVDPQSKELTESIYGFLTYYSGYDNNSVYGHFITDRLNYNDEIAKGNMKYVDHMWQGTNRTYIVYVPDSVKAKYNKENPAPVVFANHGAGQTAFVFMEATDIKEAAQKYGFIAVTFDTTSNADYMADLYEMVKADCLDLGVAVDESRVYAYGQSAGGGSVANTMAQADKVVDLFAAFGYTSGTRAAAADSGSEKVVPVYAIYGEYDYWPMKLGALGAGEWTGSQKTQYAWSTDTQSYWAKRLLGKTLDELVDPASYTFVDGIGAAYKPLETPISLILNPTATANRYKTYTWTNEVGAPIFTWGQCYGRGHNLVPSDLDQLWNECYNKWQKQDDNTVLYWANGVGNGTPVVVDQTPLRVKNAVDFDSYTEKLAYDYSQAAQLPLTGYFTKTVSEGRTMKMYISEEASVRSYMTVVAVPNGVDTFRFLKSQGWIDVMDKKGEVLVVLEPGKDGWGSAADEIAYVNAAMGFARGTNNANGIPVFSTFGEFYFVGYGEGAAPLECYAAQNPILVIAQEYIGGASAGTEALTAVASTPYNGKSSNGDITDVLDETIAAVGISGVAAPKDLAVPTVLAGYTGSEAYWMAANNCVAEAVNGVYYQDINAANYSTDYANSVRKADGETTGLSQVKIAEAGDKAANIYAYLAQWTRYDTTFAYSNALATRLDYTAARVAAQQDAKDGVVNKVLSDGTEILAQNDIAIKGHGTVQVGVIAFADNSGDGKNDPREYIMYVPECAAENTPVLFIYPGNSQTDSIFMDSTLWWQVAEKEGIVLMFICETYSSNATVVSHANSDLFYASLMTVLQEQVDGKYCGLDMSRVYCSGQSAGSIATQGFAMTDPEMFAAVASTSATPVPSDLPNASSYDGVMVTAKAPAYEAIPTMLISGQMDIGDLAKGFESDYLQVWANYMLKVNQIAAPFTAEGASSVTYLDSRHPALYSWANAQGIPMVQWAQCLLRPHNCYPSSMPMLWDYLKHFSKVDGVRYYSASAFAENDCVAIEEAPKALSRVKIPATDPMKGIYQPITGLYTDDTLSGRTAKVYIPEGIKYGAYSVMLNTPFGMDSVQFLNESGWKQVADENKIVVYVLEPKADGTYGTEEEELAYIAAAYKSFTSATYYKLGASYYFVGYGDEGTVLQKYAMTNPMAIAAAAYINASNIDAEYLASMAEKPADSRSTAMANDVPTPVWFFGATPAGVIDYYMNANRCDGSASVAGALSSTVFTQTADTLYYEQGNIGKVAVSPAAPALGVESAAAIYDFLDEYFTYGSVATGWMTGERAVYGDGEGQVKTVEFVQNFNGVDYAREYVVYDGSHGKKDVPLVIAAPGNGTSDIVMMDTSMWWKIAEEKEFVAVVMTAVPGAAGAKIGGIGEDTHGTFDLEYVDMIVDQVTKDYSIDTKRMYFSGQSQGSVFTHWVALNRADVFAAVASTSGAPQKSMLDYPAAEDYDKYVEIPYYLIAGDYDVCPVVMPATGDTRSALSMMIGINDCVVDVDNWSSEVVDGRYTDYTWNNAAGQPVVKFSRCGGRGHSVVISDNYRLYDFMMLWSK